MYTYLCFVDHEYETSVCSNFTPDASKKDQCRNCLKKKCEHSTTSTSTVEGRQNSPDVVQPSSTIQQEKLSLLNPRAQSSTPKIDQTVQSKDVLSNTTKISQNTGNNTAVNSNIIPPNVSENNSKLFPQAKRSVSVVSFIFIYTHSQFIEHYASSTQSTL